jgi:2-polyprenyl-3-methyl-5-hydroxy-6-metoxy-1,4-benzoquinol methylase
MAPLTDLEKIRGFYEEFATKFLADYIHGNERVKRQCQFFSMILPRESRKILILGCGSGEAAFHIATKVAPRARILALDISAAALEIANKLFSHERIEYRQGDAIERAPDGKWDFVILPDVYEHVPRERRGALHAELNSLMSKEGAVLLTVPSPAKQASLRTSGTGLQPIDEIVTLEDLLELATDVQAVITYFNVISVWERNDYIHAVIQRGGDQTGPIGLVDSVPLRGRAYRGICVRGREFVLYRLRLFKLQELGRLWKVRRRIRRTL